LQITRIKAGRNTWAISLQEVIDDTTRRQSKVTVGSGIDADFQQAVANLKLPALDFIGAPSAWDENGRVTGLTITYNEDGELAGGVVSIAVPIDGANGPLNIATPYAEITDGNQGLPKALADAIEAAVDAAEIVIVAVAKQHELFAA
jgi:hypothetical protein